MGVFDTFSGEVKCPHCKGKKHYFYYQTKDFECNMDDLMLGDYIDKGNTNYVYEAEGLCYAENKNFKVNVIIKNGQIVRFVNDNELKTININHVKNIEEGLGRKLQYLDHCNRGVGLAKERLTYVKGKPLKKGEEIVILNNKWTIEEVFNEKFDTNSSKFNKFCKIVYKDSYVYKVNGVLGYRYVRVDDYSTRVFLTNDFKPQIGCVLEEVIKMGV